MNPQLDMMVAMHEVLMDGEQLQPDEAFGHLLDYAASRLTFQDTIPTPWMKLRTIVRLDNILDFDVLRLNPWDWFGELHEHMKLTVIAGDFYIDYNEAHHNIDASLVPTQEGKPLRILDECAATGCNILALHKTYPDAIFYGAENDEFTYRILMLNMKLYGVNHVIVNGAHTEHDLRAFSPNWRFSNRWTPPEKKKYFTEEETDERVNITDEGVYRLV